MYPTERQLRTRKEAQRLFLNLLSTHELPFSCDENRKVVVMSCKEDRNQYTYNAEGTRARMHTLCAKGKGNRVTSINK